MNTTCVICGEEFTEEELATIDTNEDGLHGQHTDLATCKTGETELDMDCDCTDGGPLFTHPGCCPSCNGIKTGVQILALFANLVGDEGEDEPFTGTIWQGPWSVN